MLERTVLRFRSFVQEPMRWAPCSWPGRRPHRPPTGARGLSLALHDVTVLAEVLVKGARRHRRRARRLPAPRAAPRLAGAELQLLDDQLLHAAPGGSSFDLVAPARRARQRGRHPRRPHLPGRAVHRLAHPRHGLRPRPRRSLGFDHAGADVPVHRCAVRNDLARERGRPAPRGRHRPQEGAALLRPARGTSAASPGTSGSSGSGPRPARSASSPNYWRTVGTATRRPSSARPTGSPRRTRPPAAAVPARPGRGRQRPLPQHQGRPALPEVPFAEALRARPGLRDFGRYGTQLEAWLAHHPLERFLVLVYEEDIRPDDAKPDALRRTFAHLGVDTTFRAGRHRSAAQRAAERLRDAAAARLPELRREMEQVPEGERNSPRWTISVPEADRHALAEDYRPEVERLEELLGPADALGHRGLSAGCRPGWAPHPGSARRWAARSTVPSHWAVQDLWRPSAEAWSRGGPPGAGGHPRPSRPRCTTARRCRSP